jgi:hypothetical protein
VLESDLYPAVKAFLQQQGYDVKGEVGGCDVVATRNGERPVIVELKLAFSLGLVLQGVDRLSLTDRVYLAVARPGRRTAGISVHRRDVRALCRRLGLGLLTVSSSGIVEVLVETEPYQPRIRRGRLVRLLVEHSRRAGDPTRGGVTRTPIMTAYRQEALRCAMLLGREGEPTTLRALRQTGLVPNASSILRRDVYGWFERIQRATYRVTDRAREALARFAAAGTLPELPVAPLALPAPAPAADARLHLRAPSRRRRRSRPRRRA